MNEMDILFLMVTVCCPLRFITAAAEKKKEPEFCHRFNKYKSNIFYFSSAVLIIGVSRIFLAPLVNRPYNFFRNLLSEF